jgi:hypothetical protein
MDILHTSNTHMVKLKQRMNRSMLLLCRTRQDLEETMAAKYRLFRPSAKKKSDESLANGARDSIGMVAQSSEWRPVVES